MVPLLEVRAWPQARRAKCRHVWLTEWQLFSDIMYLQIHGDVPSFPTLPIWAAILLSFILVPLTGLFAGLTIGLLSLDNVGLRVRVQETCFPSPQIGTQPLCSFLRGERSDVTLFADPGRGR